MDSSETVTATPFNFAFLHLKSLVNVDNGLCGSSIDETAIFWSVRMKGNVRK